MHSTPDHPSNPALTRDNIVASLTRDRLAKYLHTTHNDLRKALRLYVLNAKSSAALMVDLHYVEVCIRNPFHRQLTPRGSLPVPGKVIAELPFGFWCRLTDARYEHGYWTTCLHRSFMPRKTPKRAHFNQRIERLRQMRNRIAHHEPIFHMDLPSVHFALMDVATLVCPATARMMARTTSVRQASDRLECFRARHGLVSVAGGRHGFVGKHGAWLESAQNTGLPTAPPAL